MRFTRTLHSDIHDHTISKKSNDEYKNTKRKGVYCSQCMPVMWDECTEPLNETSLVTGVIPERSLFQILVTTTQVPFDVSDTSKCSSARHRHSTHPMWLVDIKQLEVGRSNVQHTVGGVLASNDFFPVTMKRCKEQWNAHVTC